MSSGNPFEDGSENGAGNPFTVSVGDTNNDDGNPFVNEGTSGSPTAVENTKSNDEDITTSSSSLTIPTTTVPGVVVATAPEVKDTAEIGEDGTPMLARGPPEYATPTGANVQQQQTSASYYATKTPSIKPQGSVIGRVARQRKRSASLGTPVMARNKAKHAAGNVLSTVPIDNAPLERLEREPQLKAGKAQKKKAKKQAKEAAQRLKKERAEAIMVSSRPLKATKNQKSGIKLSSPLRSLSQSGSKSDDSIDTVRRQRTGSISNTTLDPLARLSVEVAREHDKTKRFASVTAANAGGSVYDPTARDGEKWRDKNNTAVSGWNSSFAKQRETTAGGSSDTSKNNTNKKQKHLHNPYVSYGDRMSELGPLAPNHTPPCPSLKATKPPRGQKSSSTRTNIDAETMENAAAQYRGLRSYDSRLVARPHGTETFGFAATRQQRKETQASSVLTQAAAIAPDQVLHDALTSLQEDSARTQREAGDLQIKAHTLQQSANRIARGASAVSVVVNGDDKNCRDQIYSNVQRALASRSVSASDVTTSAAASSNPKHGSRSKTPMRRTRSSDAAPRKSSSSGGGSYTEYRKSDKYRGRTTGRTTGKKLIAQSAHRRHTSKSSSGNSDSSMLSGHGHHHHADDGTTTASTATMSSSEDEDRVMVQICNDKGQVTAKISLEGPDDRLLVGRLGADLVKGDPVAYTCEGTAPHQVAACERTREQIKAWEIAIATQQHALALRKRAEVEQISRQEAYMQVQQLVSLYPPAPPTIYAALPDPEDEEVEEIIDINTSEVYPHVYTSSQTTTDTTGDSTLDVTTLVAAAVPVSSSSAPLEFEEDSPPEVAAATVAAAVTTTTFVDDSLTLYKDAIATLSLVNLDDESTAETKAGDTRPVNEDPLPPTSGLLDSVTPMEPPVVATPRDDPELALLVTKIEEYRDKNQPEKEPQPSTLAVGLSIAEQPQSNSSSQKTPIISDDDVLPATVDSIPLAPLPSQPPVRQTLHENKQTHSKTSSVPTPTTTFSLLASQPQATIDVGALCKALTDWALQSNERMTDAMTQILSVDALATVRSLQVQHAEAIQLFDTQLRTQRTEWKEIMAQERHLHAVQLREQNDKYTDLQHENRQLQARLNRLEAACSRQFLPLVEKLTQEVNHRTYAMVRREQLQATQAAVGQPHFNTNGDCVSPAVYRQNAAPTVGLWDRMTSAIGWGSSPSPPALSPPVASPVLPALTHTVDIILHQNYPSMHSVFPDDDRMQIFDELAHREANRMAAKATAAVLGCTQPDIDITATVSHTY